MNLFWEASEATPSPSNRPQLTKHHEDQRSLNQSGTMLRRTGWTYKEYPNLCWSHHQKEMSWYHNKPVHPPEPGQEDLNWRGRTETKGNPQDFHTGWSVLKHQLWIRQNIKKCWNGQDKSQTSVKTHWRKIEMQHLLWAEPTVKCSVLGGQKTSWYLVWPTFASHRTPAQSTHLLDSIRLLIVACGVHSSSMAVPSCWYWHKWVVVNAVVSTHPAGQGAQHGA